jgi:hypothetical protein
MSEIMSLEETTALDKIHVRWIECLIQVNPLKGNQSIDFSIAYQKWQKEVNAHTSIKIPNATGFLIQVSL